MPWRISLNNLTFSLLSNLEHLLFVIKAGNNLQIHYFLFLRCYHMPFAPHSPLFSVQYYLSAPHYTTILPWSTAASHLIFPPPSTVQSHSHALQLHFVFYPSDSFASVLETPRPGHPCLASACHPETNTHVLFPPRDTPQIFKSIWLALCLQLK